MENLSGEPCIAVDYECSFKDYVKTISHHAEYDAQPGRPEFCSHACRTLRDAACRAESDCRYDAAYFYYMRIICIIEKNNLRNEKGMLSLLGECVDSVERLLKKELREFFDQKLHELHKRKKEWITDCSLKSVHDGNILEHPEEEHRKRRQGLLDNEKTNLENTKKTLSASHIPVTTSKLSNPSCPYVNVCDNSQEKEIIVPPKRASNVSPNAYVSWSYNCGTLRKSGRKRGIVNLGNTCYLNSVVQMLSSTPLGSYFLSDNYTKGISDTQKTECRLVNTFSFVMRELFRVECTFPVSPSLFKQTIDTVNSTFSGFFQQDANEFLRILLEGIHNNLNSKRGVKSEMSEIDNINGSDVDIAGKYWAQYTKLNSSVIVDLCIFQERSSIVCSICKKKSRSFPPSLGIEVPIQFSKKQISIEDCLGAYCREETLDSDSLYHCISCKKNVKATKQLLLYSLPKILFITIKRFRSYGDFSNKISDPIVFQKHLDMAPFMCSNQKNTIYSLVSVVNHQGSTGGGHYTADCITSEGVWFSVSDERVEESKSPDYRHAYILCYVRAG
ncbi:putative ubiquitin hydrolase [Trypanosoma vivax]|uniref:Ubiquitin carboxyl-terminal hydrolase n=1 Tax=Trypanosoma vivax (strain Y486) TaxID=1055687 RepID=G0UA73_TRYVY|nr:putative ubiquitin hydrolase [Trypanosoma vivax]CCC52705.1 putative ubiquitin hydrolase [Trypanosoma vivax Y486]